MWLLLTIYCSTIELTSISGFSLGGEVSPEGMLAVTFVTQDSIFYFPTLIRVVFSLLKNWKALKSWTDTDPLSDP